MTRNLPGELSLSARRASLEARRRELDAEIRDYPTPIPRCDAQFNHLFEERDRIVREIDSLATIPVAAPAVDAQPQPIREWHGVDEKVFREEVAARYEPAVLRGVVAHWPAVRSALDSPAAACSYLAALDRGAQVDALRTPPSAKGRIFYNEALSGFNFTRERATISALLERIVKYAAMQNPPAVAAQSALLADCLPGFSADNPLRLLHESVQPRIWLGNAVVTPAHFDESSNIACVVAGRRRFTLLPPEQIANLYVGPLDFAPTGTPISLVSFREPDFKRFPRFRTALAHAQVAELGPGDALYIPALWWHHVESLERLNVLVNYWWKGSPEAPGEADSALDCLYHCLLTFKHLAPEQREAWGTIFDHYVFNGTADPAEHIPEARRGVLGTVSPARARQIRAFLIDKLSQ